jgi:hypothetical protein
MQDVAPSRDTLQRYLWLTVWLFFAGAFFSIAGQWTTFTYADRQFTDYVDTLVNRAALERKPAREVRTLVLLKADELSIPVRKDQISITGQGETLASLIDYDAEITIPMVHRVLYRMEFTHNFHNRVLK